MIDAHYEMISIWDMPSSDHVDHWIEDISCIDLIHNFFELVDHTTGDELAAPGEDLKLDSVDRRFSIGSNRAASSIDEDAS